MAFLALMRIHGEQCCRGDVDEKISFLKVSAHCSALSSSSSFYYQRRLISFYIRTLRGRVAIMPMPRPGLSVAWMPSIEMPFSASHVAYSVESEDEGSRWSIIGATESRILTGVVRMLVKA